MRNNQNEDNSQLQHLALILRIGSNSKQQQNMSQEELNEAGVESQVDNFVGKRKHRDNAGIEHSRRSTAS